MIDPKIEKLRQLESRRTDLDSKIMGIRKRLARVEKAKLVRRKILAGEYLLRLVGNDWARVAERLKSEGKLSERDAELFE